MPVERLIEVKDISFSYGTDEILNDISFEVSKGDYIGLIGPNGAGKTTLLKIMLNLLRPSKGSVSFFGKNIKEFKDWPKIGYVPQKVTNFDVNFPATVSEVVLMGRYGRRGLFKRVTDFDRQIVKRALEQVDMCSPSDRALGKKTSGQVDMCGLEDRLIGELSGGQQQRVFIARALATEPEIIFLDEPTVGVDQKTRNEFYALLQKLNKEMNLTLVLVSHDISVLSGQVSRIICVDRSMVCDTSPKEFMADSSLADLFHGNVGIMTHKHHHQ